MNKGTFRPLCINILTLFVLCLLSNLPIIAQQNLDEKKLDELFKAYRVARKFPCGQRAEAIQIGKEILEKYARENPFEGVFPYIKRDVEKIEAEEKKCKSDAQKDFNVLYEEFKSAIQQPCGKRDEAFRIGRFLIEKFEPDAHFRNIANFIKDKLAKIEEEEKKCKLENSNNSLENLYEKFKIARKSDCGQRAEAVRLGTLIIEKFGNDPINQEIIQYVKNQTAKIEQEEESCNFKKQPPRNRAEFIKLSKKIIEKESDSLLALDVMLTLVSVGYEHSVIEKDDTFIRETLFYAETAIKKIESGQISKTWGVFAPFKTKENALGWMNYIIGWIKFNKLNNRKEAFSYLYKAVQFDGELSRTWAVYQVIANYYFDFLGSNIELWKEENLETAKGYTDRALIFLAKGYELAVENKAAKEHTDFIYFQLSNLYKYRFNIAANEKAEGLENFLNVLTSQPIPDLNSPVVPIFEEPIEVKLMRNKVQKMEKMPKKPISNSQILQSKPLKRKEAPEIPPILRRKESEN